MDSAEVHEASGVESLKSIDPSMVLSFLPFLP